LRLGGLVGQCRVETANLLERVTRVGAVPLLLELFLLVQLPSSVSDEPLPRWRILPQAVRWVLKHLVAEWVRGLCGRVGQLPATYLR